MDELDRKILHLLSQNCLTPFVRIAKKLRVAEGTVRYRVRKLEKSGAIRGFKAVIDPRQLGLGALVFVTVTVLPSHLPQVASALSTLENVLGVYENPAVGILLLKISGISHAKISEFISAKISPIEGITGSQIVPVTNVWKDYAAL